MIGKVYPTGKGFGETCRYVCEDLLRAEVLAVEGVRGHDHKLMAEDFKLQQRFEPIKEKPVFHSVLSFHPDERPDDERIVEIAQKFLDRIGMGNTQYAIVKHTDRGHLHAHIIANRVNNDGEIIGKGLIIRRGVKAAQQLTLEYGLRPDVGKDLSRTNRQALHPPDAIRYRLYEKIKDALPGCRCLEDLQKKLLKQGITTRIRTDPATGERQGISFRSEKMAFAGIKVDPSFSLPKIELRLKQQLEQDELRLKKQLQEEQRMEQRQRRALRPGM